MFIFTMLSLSSKLSYMNKNYSLNEKCLCKKPGGGVMDCPPETAYVMYIIYMYICCMISFTLVFT